MKKGIIFFVMNLCCAIADGAIAGEKFLSFGSGYATPGQPARIELPIQNAESPISVLTTDKIFQSLTSIKNNTRARTRGVKESRIFRDISPSVVLVVTNDGLGSGSYIGNNLILTNWHVVQGYKQVGVAFKPEDKDKVSEDDFIIGNVIRRDEIKDLALLKINSAPDYVQPIQISDADNFEVGSDVHAIGHPHGLSWSYTKGLISQYRPDYSWEIDKKIKHHADIIQTQTPINGGNSGGPLLSDDEKIIGVNSYKEDGEALNFAVAAPSIREFLANKNNVIANNLEASKDDSQKSGASNCKPSIIFEGRNKSDDANLRQFSLNCDGWPDLTFVVPDNTSKPIMAFYDGHKRKKADGVIYDYERKGKWKISYWDPELDDTFPLVGFHPNGEIVPSSYSKRCKSGQPRTDGSCQ